MATGELELYQYVPQLGEFCGEGCGKAGGPTLSIEVMIQFVMLGSHVIN